MFGEPGNSNRLLRRPGLPGIMIATPYLPPRTTRGSFAHPNYLTGSLLRAGGGQATVPQWRSRLTGSGAVPRIAAKGEALRGGRKQNEQHAYAVRLPHYSLIGDQGVGSQLFWTSFAGACPAFALQGWTGDAMIT
ncbi:hypothetical protein MCOR27_006940 [Pyricularia oryzae]|nr:hypothetical protein MCOR01_003126 [Pyricularia oryzae]KAI6251987.1 hypothetical protein MCOR19_011387 [Pyricularia oryzae]KAI6275544.1 hypothetical protein MCOR27_006940 [Pyricularia oryzae]KAI6307840.1 hypothetical protein MCOR29_009531 [Pyricularia oryzae]KAI6324995.1 hypothetical protein MCOR30_006951 [Pyricularia oryzae]